MDAAQIEVIFRREYGRTAARTFYRKFTSAMGETRCSFDRYVS